MEKIILLRVENRFLKGILLKSISKTGMDILDIVDIDDMNLKLDAFAPRVCMAILEITDWNMNGIRVEIDRLKAINPTIPMMAVVSKDTADIVTFAMRAGIRDVMLLPSNRELYRKTVQEKMNPYYEQFDPQKQIEEKEKRPIKEQLDTLGVKDYLKLEIKRAHRGGYPLSMLMAHMNGASAEAIDDLMQRAKSFLRETDKILGVDEQTFIGVFPFTPKDCMPLMEQKFREASEKEAGKPGHHKKLCLYGATYPQDETVLDLLLERMENGINNSMVIDSIKSPLNVLSKTEIENYKQKIRQYRRFL